MGGGGRRRQPRAAVVSWGAGGGGGGCGEPDARARARQPGLARRRAAAAGMQVASVREDTRPGRTPAPAPRSRSVEPAPSRAAEGNRSRGAWPRQGFSREQRPLAGGLGLTGGRSLCSVLVRGNSGPWRATEDSPPGGVAVVRPGVCVCGGGGTTATLGGGAAPAFSSPNSDPGGH